MSFTEPFRADMTLTEAQEILRTLLDEGAKCPVCTQFARTYRRKVHASMVKTLIAMYRQGQTSYVYLPDIPQKSRDSTGMAWWKLIAADPERDGWWRVTEVGEKWLREELGIPKYAKVYDGRCLGYDRTEYVTIRDALGTKFSFEELMNGV
jgi:hypothetical protein